MDITDVLYQAERSGTWLAYRQAARKVRELHLADPASPEIKIRAAFLSSFTIEPLVDFAVVEAAREGIYLDTYIGGYGQYSQEILDAGSGLFAFAPEVTFLMARIEDMLSEKERGLLAEAAGEASGRIISLAHAFKSNSKGALFLGTFVAQPSWPLEPIEAREESIAREANDRIKAAFLDDGSVRICDSGALAAYFGYRNVFSSEMMNMAKMPFSEGYMALLARKFIACLKAQKGLTRKCLVVDCDNTLWGGVIGEDGFDGIRLGPDFPGREYLGFQKAILELYGQGVILAINSRNNHDDVMKVIKEHPHMLLREKHFASIQANWNDKPSNMDRIAEELNIGTDSLVFLDDSPVERELMRKSRPEVLTIELPGNPNYFAPALRETTAFARFFVTEEDRARGEAYAAERRRSQLRKSAATMEDFLLGLETVVTIRLAGEQDIKRATQLTERTNQFNLTTRRYGEDDMRGFIKAPDRRVYVLHVKDKFGDNGMVGLAIVALDGGVWRIDTFLLSCRIIGRQIERAFADRILRDASEKEAGQVMAEYIRSKKNGLAESFWETAGFCPVSRSEEASAWRFDMKSFRPGEFSYLQILSG